ncbi:peptide deformylase [Gloeobacter kilaueensis]|uniref:Peptide deformylase n=1 Tax=Gloeobacter kilaueensis (strain ATCC BAA-2537 / CCAP 1431/1 / ULC 316 / JS1) TaxID=1183438 RepID=U5QPC9_GLOK1|nr:peptide deformylase [Gloeobacter kilaueensis]AGY59530.1 peptide deformylase [Gloeobacter kilaueensis JS1]
MILPIAQVGEPILHLAAQPVPIEQIRTPAFQTFLDDFVETMRSASGVGLSGPQVFRSIRVVAAECNANPRYPDRETVPLQIWINPVILRSADKTVACEEGCLSVPERRINLNRPEWIELSAFDREGEPVTFIAEGFLARILQHEIDHLDGILIVDREAQLAAPAASGTS